MSNLSEREAEVAQLCEILLAKGIKRIKVGDLEVEAFAPPAPKLEQLPDALAAMSAGPMCACGHHAIVEHMNGGCCHGCSVDECNEGLEAEAAP